MPKISTVDKLPPSNVLFKMNTQCVETDNIALYRRNGDNYIRNEYYKIGEPLPYLPDLLDPFDHLLLYREGNRSPYRATPMVTLPVHDHLVFTHNIPQYSPNSAIQFTTSSATSFSDPFDIAQLLILWHNSNNNAPVNFTEFPAIRTVAFFRVFAKSNPIETIRVFTFDPDSGLRTSIPFELTKRQTILGLSGELFSFRVLEPIDVKNLFLEYSDLFFFQGYQQTPSVFKNTIYFEDYPDRLLPNDVALRTKRTINTECTRDIAVLGTPASGIALPLIPLFDGQLKPTGFALIEKYVKNGRLLAHPRSISTPDKIRFSYSLAQTLDMAAIEFIMSMPTNLPPDITLPVFNNFIFPQTLLIEGRLVETDSWHVLDEIHLDLLDHLTFASYPNRTKMIPRRFTAFRYLTYRRPVREIRFTVQSLANYTPLLPDGAYDISRTHFYFPEICCYEHIIH